MDLVRYSAYPLQKSHKAAPRHHWNTWLSSPVALCRPTTRPRLWKLPSASSVPSLQMQHRCLREPSVQRQAHEQLQHDGMTSTMKIRTKCAEDTALCLEGQRLHGGGSVLARKGKAQAEGCGPGRAAEPLPPVLFPNIYNWVTPLPPPSWNWPALPIFIGKKKKNQKKIFKRYL